VSKKLYVGNLLYEVNDDELRDLFMQAGNVVSAQVIRYHDSQRSKGFGFVEMESEEDAQKAMDMFNGQDHKGRKLVVSEARPPAPREQRSFDRRGGGDRGPRRSFGGDRRGGDRRGGYGGGNHGGYNGGNQGSDDFGGGDIY
jgi:RNA recognition motif-containing protein